jgi:hypothetical protein
MAVGEIQALGLSAGSFSNQVVRWKHVAGGAVSGRDRLRFGSCAVSVQWAKEGVTRVPLRRLRPSRRPGVWCSPAPCSLRSAPWRPWPSLEARRSRPAKSAWSFRTGMSSRGPSPSGTVCAVYYCVCARLARALRLARHHLYVGCLRSGARGRFQQAASADKESLPRRWTLSYRAQSAAACSPALLLHTGTRTGISRTSNSIWCARRGSKLPTTRNLCRTLLAST